MLFLFLNPFMVEKKIRIKNKPKNSDIFNKKKLIAPY